MTPDEREKQHKADIEQIIGIPSGAGRRFILRVIQMGGIFSRTTDGSDERNLDYDEGRRNLALEILEMFEAAQPQAPLPDIPAATLTQALLEAARNHTEDQNAKRRPSQYDRSQELSDDPPDAD